MAGPIVSNGILIGGLALTRDRSNNAFNQQNILDLIKYNHNRLNLTKMRVKK